MGWPYALGIAAGVLVITIVSVLCSRGPVLPDCCLVVLPVGVISALGAATFLAATEIRTRFLGRKFRTRAPWQAWLAGMLLPWALAGILFGSPWLPRRDREAIFYILLVATFFAYPFIAAVVLIRPLHALASIAPVITKPDEADVPLADLAEPASAQPQAEDPFRAEGGEPQGAQTPPPPS